jgi:hypothetical protein
VPLEVRNAGGNSDSVEDGTRKPILDAND